MSKEKDQIIKYTIVPKNDKEDYDSNFKLSLTEFAKALEGKALLAPLILYNSDLDIPLDMDESLIDYIIYTDKDSILNVIKKQELTDVFRTLVIHGFDVTLDEVREIYCPLSRRNQADICINTIQDLELDNNLTFYLYNDLDLCPEDEWQETKDNLQQDMKDYIEEYKSYEDMTEEDLMNLLPMFFDTFDEIDLREESDDDDSLLSILENAIKAKEAKEEKKQEPKAPIPFPVPSESKSNLPEKEEEMEPMITVAYEYESYISLNKLSDDLYTIQDDDYEVLLTADQIDFIMQAYNRIKDKPVK
jgi:hypothetical protein